MEKKQNKIKEKIEKGGRSMRKPGMLTEDEKGIKNVKHCVYLPSFLEGKRKRGRRD